jgi:hypothetical protein
MLRDSFTFLPFTFGAICNNLAQGLSQSLPQSVVLLQEGPVVAESRHVVSGHAPISNLSCHTSRLSRKRRGLWDLARR